MTPTDLTPITTGKKVGFTLAGLASILLAIISVVVVAITYGDWSFSRSPQTLALLIAAAVACLFFAWLAYFCFSQTKPKLLPLEKPAFCQACGSSAPRMKAGLNRHIGAVVLMFHKSYKGYFCRACIAKVFWEYTPVTLIFGWWGIFSFFITPIVLINNVIFYLRSLSLDHTPPYPSKAIED